MAKMRWNGAWRPISEPSGAVFWGAAGPLSGSGRLTDAADGKRDVETPRENLSEKGLTCGSGKEERYFYIYIYIYIFKQ